jgi:hypothetical protein
VVVFVWGLHFWVTRPLADPLHERVMGISHDASDAYKAWTPPRGSPVSERLRLDLEPFGGFVGGIQRLATTLMLLVEHGLRL